MAAAASAGAETARKTRPAGNIGNRIPSSGPAAGTRPGAANDPASSPADAIKPFSRAGDGAKSVSTEPRQRHGSDKRELPPGAAGSGKTSAGATKRFAAVATAATINPASANPPAASANFSAATTLPALQPLLQLVSTLASIDVPQVKKWFEFARLIRTASTPGQTAPGAGDFAESLIDLEA